LIDGLSRRSRSHASTFRSIVASISFLVFVSTNATSGPRRYSGSRLAYLDGHHPLVSYRALRSDAACTPRFSAAGYSVAALAPGMTAAHLPFVIVITPKKPAPALPGFGRGGSVRRASYPLSCRTGEVFGTCLSRWPGFAASACSVSTRFSVFRLTKYHRANAMPRVPFANPSTIETGRLPSGDNFGHFSAKAGDKNCHQ